MGKNFSNWLQTENCFNFVFLFSLVIVLEKETLPFYELPEFTDTDGIPVLVIFKLICKKHQTLPNNINYVTRTSTGNEKVFCCLISATVFASTRR